MPDSPLWRPDAPRRANSLMRRFARQARQRGAPLAETALHDPPAYYDALHEWSIREMGDFWELVWDFCGVVGDKGAAPFFVAGDDMAQGRFFPQARLNFAENLLNGGAGREGEIALRFRDEARIDSGEDQTLTWAELRRRVARVQRALRAAGIGKGDRVAAVLPNMPASVILALASASLGAIFSSCSPDYGARGILDRFSQIAPKLLVVCDSCRYNGKRFAQAEKIREVLAALPEQPHKPQLWVQRIAFDENVMDIDGARCFEEIAGGGDSAETPALHFELLPFDHPLYIVFSSGTTGAPKCIVHRAGGVLLQHLKEHQLHGDVRRGDGLCYFTACSWMMWNWMVSALASGAQVQLYDGSPLYPDNASLFAYAAAARTTHLGVSPKLLDVLRQGDVDLRRRCDLSALRCIFSAGSPLGADNFRYVHERIKGDVHLSSISGGTELISCFVGGNPDAPVWEGEMQCKNLGMAVEMWDENGKPLQQEKGELVCRLPFPTMPLQFWNDADGSRYRSAYFEHFPGFWRHGDFAAFTEHGGVIIFGRSDALLNIGGIRVGTSEVYGVVERFGEVVESVAIAQEWQGDARIVLFVRLQDGLALDADLQQRMRAAVAKELNPRFVPAVIVAVDDIPRTKSGKITELAVRDMVHGREIKNRTALANPEALELFRDLPQLAPDTA